MIGPFGRRGPGATLRQHFPQMTQRRCTQYYFLDGAVLKTFFKFLNLYWIIRRGILKEVLRNPAGNSNSLIQDPFALVAFLRRHEADLSKEIVALIWHLGPHLSRAPFRVIFMRLLAFVKYLGKIFFPAKCPLLNLGFGLFRRYLLSNKEWGKKAIERERERERESRCW